MSETALRKAAAHVVCAPLTVWLMLVAWCCYACCRLR
jgi:hypothetical protein